MLDGPIPGITRLGGVLRYYREAAGLNQEELARLSNVDDTNISKIEQGKTRRPQSNTLMKLAEVLAPRIPGKTVDQIFEHLDQTKLKSRTEYTVDPTLVAIDDLLKTVSPSRRRQILTTIAAVIETMVDLAKR